MRRSDAQRRCLARLTLARRDLGLCVVAHHRAAAWRRIDRLLDDYLKLRGPGG